MSRRLVLAFLVVVVLTGCAAHGSGSSSPPAGPASGGLNLPPAASTSSVSPAGAAAAVRLGGDWPSYHGDATRAGYSPASPDPSSPAVAWRAALDGEVYASPLVVGARVIAATESGSLYSLDAATGAVQWSTHLADPVPKSALPCGDIDRLGITGTPVFDPASGQVFAVTTQAGPKHVLWGVDAATGQVRQQRDVDAPGSEPATQLQRAALLVSGGTVYVAYGGNDGDCGQYLGRVVAAPTSGTAPMSYFAVPTTREAGIWGASGPVGLPGGDIVITTGNGDATGGAWDHSDSVLRLSSQLQLRDGFAPPGWAQENSVDADLGSTGPVLLPGGGQVIAAGKGGGIYLTDVAALGGVGGQQAQTAGCASYGGGATAPVRSGGAVAYLPCASGVLQVRVEPGNRLTRGWQAPSHVTGSPVVAGATVWSQQQDGALYGLDAATGQTRALLQVGDSTRFATPALSGNALFVATRTGITAVTIAP